MDKLKFINEQMDLLAIRYELGVYKSPVVHPYWVGEFTEEPILSEDGAEESTLILTGWHRGKRIDLEKDKAKIKKHFHPIFGLRGSTDSGSIAVFFDSAFPVPSDEADLHKEEIHLKIKEWKGDL